ncbi:MAG: class A beta-lactamase-related serine hydrolase [Bacteroidia bacterium]|nr:class A beta-lactamase-related serine hydrolase [Bacteroidia bacterium]
MRIYGIGMFILLTSLNVSFGQTKIEQLDELLNLYTEYGQFNGSVLVAEKGEIIYKKGFGLANMEWNILNQPNTKYRLGSLTKQFTAMLILQMASENKLKLDVPISTYLPDYPKPNGDDITIHHLLTHSSGIPNYTSFPNFRNKERNRYSPEEMIRFFADSTLQFTPGEKYEYSNSGYFLLGAIIEKVTGKSYEQVLQDKIFTPLKMINTGYDHHSTILKNRASGYEREWNSRVFINAAFVDMSIPYAAGSIYSTVEDLYLWDQALYSNQLLSKEYMDLIFANHGSGYGYGWGVNKDDIHGTGDSLSVIEHQGGINGFHTQIFRIPSDKNLIVLFNNTSRAPLDAMTTTINRILYDKPYDLPKKSIALSLFDVIEKDGVTTALSYYKEVKDSSHCYLNDDEMNQVGYQLLNSDRANEAAFIFKLNVEAFPNSWNVYDSYGEVLLVLGNKAQAIENYKKSVQLNPGNENGIKILKELKNKQ